MIRLRLEDKGLKLLRQVRELFEDPNKWTGGSFARDDKGHPVSFNAPNAVCWCLEGGLRKFAENNNPLSDGYIDAVVALGENCLSDKNDDFYDNKDHSGFMEWLNNAIARREQVSIDTA